MRWNMAARVLQQVFSIAMTVVLARMLTPNDYGLVGMVAVFTAFASTLADLGISAAVVQRSAFDEKELSSVFWLTVLVGAGLSLLLFLVAPLVSAFYELPILAPITRVTAAGFLLSGLINIPRALLSRRMDFQKIAGMDVVAAITGGLTALTLAANGAGVWALVFSGFASQSTVCIGSFVLTRWRPQLIFDRHVLRPMAGFGAPLTGFNIINYWARNADNLFIGKLLGAGELGIYSRAYGLMLLPLTQLASVAGDVMFPALSSIQSDRARVRTAYLRAMGVLTLFCFPLMGGLFVVSRDFVATILGPRWMEVVPVLRILCPVGIVQTIMNPAGWLYMSQGRPDLLLKWGGSSAILIIMALGIGAAMGSIESVAWAYLVINLLLLVPDIIIPGRLVGLGLRDMARICVRPFGCTVIMAIAVAVLGHFLPPHWDSWQRLLISVSAGTLIYVVLGFSMGGESAREVVHFITLKRR
jgi:O-antigen/teichoic acid export membrane protein